MQDKKIKLTKKNFVLLLYVAMLSVLGPLIFWVGNRGTNLSSLSTLRDSESSAEKLISLGEDILVQADNNLTKQAGVDAFASKDWNRAVKEFSTYLINNPNDPEALIYLNNANAILSNNSVKIAVSVPIGGNLNVAKEILRGVAQAQREINLNGGINGTLIQVLIANDDNDPKVAQTIATELVKDESILAVIGHNDSNASLAAAPIYQQGSLTMITPTSSAEDLTIEGDYIFRSTPSTRALAETLAVYTVESARKRKIAICYDGDSVVSESFKKEFTWSVYQVGGEIINTDCNITASNFNPSEIPSKLISHGAEAVLLAPSVRQISRAVEIAQANQDRLTLLGNHSMNSYTTLQQGQNTVNGMVLAVPWDWEQAQNSDSFFALDAKQLWKGAVNWRTAMAYDATKAIFASFKTGFERERVQASLADPSFSTAGATESISFLPSGDRNMQGTLVKVVPHSGSNIGYTFVSLDQAE